MYNFLTSQRRFGVSRKLVDSNGIIHYYHIECLTSNGENDNAWTPAYHRINKDTTISWKNYLIFFYYYCPSGEKTDKFPQI